MNKKLHLEKRILKISIVGSIVFMLAEGVMAYITRSNSILMDCIFDTADLIMVGPFLMLIPLLYKPVTEKHPYGYSQVESLFVIIKCVILLLITAQVMFYSIHIIFKGGNHVNGGVIAAFEMALSAGCILIYAILRHYNRMFSSPSIKADLYMWRMDIINSLGVGLTFTVQSTMDGTGFSWLIPYVDPIVAIVMAIVFSIEPVRMVINGIKNLVLFAPEEEIMDSIRNVINKHLENYPYTVNFLDVIQTGRKAWVGVYLKAESDCIRISQLKQAHAEIKKELTQHFDQIYIELIPESFE
ncbi:cation diffusion facilitator family transporter [Aminipila luticellarii]|uniref:Cation diffusion facilitator family transporter n=1 Tax=Aminipila luticellarii TaxID=2507160 RepID=A0A410PTC0_9FIRM|nr:cation diffusion facilitator family transporter [Aminipila luticellarii]QAT42154.1 cation diffusion facilitator family transporter [Aminipila luticellarii]